MFWSYFKPLKKRRVGGICKHNIKEAVLSSKLLGVGQNTTLDANLLSADRGQEKFKIRSLD